jgi:hypothetical protein
MGLVETLGFRALKTRETFVGVGGVELVVSQLGWDAGTSIEEVEAGALATRLIGTQDGRHYAAGGWHEGESAEQVYVERYEMRGAAFVRVFHGWIDSESRKLVQAG